MKCVLCHQGDAEVSGLGMKDAYVFQCPRCGTYHVTRRTSLMLAAPNYDPDVRLRLTWAARQASELGAPLELDSENLEEIAGAVVEPHPPSRKVDSLLLVLGNRSETFGSVVELKAERDWPLVFARDETEFNSLRQTVVEQGHVQPGPQGFRLMPTGWSKFEQLEAERPKSTAAFVAMWFAPEMQSTYDEAFYPALYNLGYDPIRVDREHYLGKVDDFIIASIRKSAILVADFTGMRSGVFFEAGFGLGLGIPVVWSCREDWLEKLKEHFDTRQYPHLQWTDAADLKVKLRSRIEAAVVGRPRPRS